MPTVFSPSLKLIQILRQVAACQSEFPKLPVRIPEPEIKPSGLGLASIFWLGD